MADAPDRNPEFESLLDFIKWNRGFDFTGYKRASLMRRFERRMQSLRIRGYDQYHAYLEEHPEEFAKLFDTILINVTGFFRDGPMWEYVASSIVPRLVEKIDEFGSIRVWSAGCSTGEEPYTAAIVLAEALPEEVFRTRVKIYATDADESALAAGRAATYTPDAIKHLPDPLREKYFEQTNGKCALRNELRRTVIFGRHDLMQDPPISKVDLLIARNTLMYFQPAAQAQVLANFHFALRDSGYLFLGKSEVLMTRTSLFTPVDLRRRVFARVPEAKRNLPPRPDRIARAAAPTAAPRDLRDAAFDAARVAQIVVDGRGRIALANQLARNLFGLMPEDIGAPLQDLELSYRPVDLRSAIDELHERGSAVHLRNAAWTDARGAHHVLDVHVGPLQSDGDGGDGVHGMPVAISFVDITRHTLLQQSVETTRQENETAFEELQATFEELETTNEELQSTNEELETTNEELQAANEELETMNEELQSTNEELESTNDLLGRRTGELDAANAFLAAVLSSLDAAVVVLDREQVVTAWNEVATDTWGVREDEARGQHFMNLDIGLPVEQLRRPILDVLADGGMSTMTLAATNRRGRSITCAVTLTPLHSVNGDESRGVIMFLTPTAPA